MTGSIPVSPRPRRSQFLRGARHEERSLVIPNERRITPQRAKTGPALRVARQMAPCGVAGLGKGPPFPASRACGTPPGHGAIWRSNAARAETGGRPWAPAVFATRQAFERLVDLVQQLLFPLHQAQLPLPLLLGGADIGDVAADIGLAQLGEFLIDARLKLGTLGQQQLAEELLLDVVHVVIGWQGQQLGFGSRGQGHGKSAGLF